MEKYKHLKNLPMAIIQNEKLLLLIGQDNINLIASRTVQMGPDNVVKVTKCKLGWSLHRSDLKSEKSADIVKNVHILHINYAENSFDQL